MWNSEGFMYAVKIFEKILLYNFLQDHIKVFHFICLIFGIWVNVNLIFKVYPFIIIDQ